MSTLLVLIGLVVSQAAFVVALLVVLRRVPEGYEDAEGFHPGRPQRAAGVNVR